MESSTKDSSLEKKVILLLSEQIGVDTEDISLDDSLREDLHMGPAELTDFAHLLQENGIGIEPASLNLADMETVEELIETIASELDFT